MIVPVIIPAVLVALFTVVYVVITGFQLYHVYSFGVWDRLNIGVAAIFFVVSLVAIFVMIMLLVTTDWSLRIETDGFSSLLP